jgi:hypothetical protein
MKKSSSFLTGFLAMLVAAGLLSSAGTAQAALISIDIGPSSGFNIYGNGGGVTRGSYAEINGFPISGNTLNIYNNFNNQLTGLQGFNGLGFASGGSRATPVNFSQGASIGGLSTYTSNFDNTAFRRDTGMFGVFESPNFGPGSYMGFQTAQGNYGWLEVTWTKESNQFQILSGAYGNTPGVAILAGGASAPIPEPGTWAAAALLAGGAAFMRWRKRAKVA